MSASRFARSPVGVGASVGFITGMLTMAAVVAIVPERYVSPAQAAAQVLSAPEMEERAVAELRQRHLELPVRGMSRADIRDSFSEKRGADRRHEAVDILAPRNTPVLAVEDGTVAKLFFSQAGGNTVYQFDPSVTYAYYYAHLERYADGLTEGARLTRGQVIGYVGTSGNAPKDTPHLHFAIFTLTDEKRWWKGAAIDPFQILR